MKIFARRLLTDEGFLTDQVVTVEKDRVAAIAPGTMEETSLVADILTPGLLDKHEHGAMGFDATHPDEEKCRAWLKMLAEHGVTNVLYTLGSGPIEVTANAVRFAARVMEEQKSGGFPGARVEGVHLEGPFLNPVRKGAMNEKNFLPPTMENFLALCGGHEEIVRAITIAPEMEGAIALGKQLEGMGIRVQAGHTDATCAQAQAAFEAGAFTGVTHFYNAARPLNQREPGVLGAALLDDRVTCEAICDFVHVAPEMLRVLIGLKGTRRVAVISDSVSTAGLPDGVYYGGNHSVVVKGGLNFTESGGIAGGAKQADTGVKNLVSLGYDPAEVFRMASTVPAEYLGIEGLGHVRVGARACLAAWDEDFRPAFAIVDGGAERA